MEKEENGEKDVVKKITGTTKKMAERTTEMVKKSKDKIVKTSSKAMNKTKEALTEEKIMDTLNILYIKSVNGIPKVSLPIDDLVEDYVSKNDSIEKAAKSLINNSIVKCGTSGFVSGFGGFLSMIVTLPANITSVMYVQLRMCCAIAKMAGYDIESDQVQTLIYACLTGSALTDVLKQAGIKFGNKITVATIKKIPGKTLTVINQKVGFKFVTKFGEHGVLNLGKMVPVVGATIGGGIDVASTKVIGNNAYKLFIEGNLSNEKDITEAELISKEINDIDTETLKKAIEENSNN